MEAVPRVPMLSLELKTSPEGVSFGAKLKQYIGECYREDGEAYGAEIHQLEGLRCAAVRPSNDRAGAQALKRYFCQLRALQTRFPMAKGQPAAVTFAWRDLFANIVCPLADIRFEMVCILYNIGALHSKLGAAESRTTPESMKAACTNFQTAVWAFQHLKEHYPQPAGVDLSPEIMKLFQDICLAQAQECILEKSMQDSRKPGIVGAIGMQAIHHYKAALAAMEPSHSADSLFETIGFKNCQVWIKSINFKLAYISCIVYLYQGMQSEEQQRMGERVAYYQLASDKLQEARKLSKSFPQTELINDALTFTNDVVEGKRKAAKNENEFIYHEEIPEKDALTEPKPVSLAKGIPINFNDPEVSGPDIFSRLVPMRAHEASSMYSEEKAKLLRRIGGSVEVKDAHLNDFMSSLQLDELNILNDTERLPQELVDICASLSVKTDAIQNLVDTMNSLADIHTDVDSMFTDVKHMLEEEEKNEKDFQLIMGKRAPSNVINELSREANKYLEAHNLANESNQTLHKAMTLHLANLRLLTLPLNELEKHVPSVESIKGTIDNNAIGDMRTLVEKVNEMRAQRSMLVLQLREAVNSDDITSQLLTRTGESLDEIFKQEIEKHNKTVGLIEQNMIAQENILKALTDAYAKYAPSRKIISDVLRKRESFLSAMTTSFEIYEDLMKKSLKGIEFYKKLSSTVQRLMSRLKSICKVQEEERTQLLASNAPKPPKNTSYNNDLTYGALPPVANIPQVDEVSSGPKLKDYLPYMKNRNSTQIPNVSETPTVDSSYVNQMYPPFVRPAPLGSEDTESVKNYQNPQIGNQSNIHQYMEPAQNINEYHNMPADYKSYQNMTYSMQQPYNENLKTIYTNPNIQQTPEMNYSTKIPDDKPYQYNSGYANPINYSQYGQNTATGYNPDYSYQNVNYSTPTSLQYDAYSQGTNQTCKVESTPQIPHSVYTPQPEQQNALNYSNYGYDPSQNQMLGQMQNLNIAPAASAAPTEAPSNVNAYQSNVAHSMANPTGIVSQQNFNINPAHISSTMNFYNQKMAEQLPQPIDSSTGLYQGMQNPYVGVQTYTSAAPQDLRSPTAETITSHVQANYGYDGYVAEITKPAHDAYSTAASADLQIQSHVQQHLGTNMAPIMPPNSVYAYPNVYYGGTMPENQQFSQSQLPSENGNNSYQNHPGYSFNVKTGQYEYNYGYQNNMANVSQSANSSSNVYPENVHQSNLYTNAGTYGTTQSISTPVDQMQTPHSGDLNSQYYSLPYGHQSNPGNDNAVDNVINNPPDVINHDQTQANIQDGKSLTYMNSNDTATMTTNSNQGTTGLKSSPSVEENDGPKTTNDAKTTTKEPSAIDLLSGLDFSIEQAPLMPEIKVPPVSECVIRKMPVKTEVIMDREDIAKEDTTALKRPPKYDLFSDPSLLNKFTQEVKSMQLFVDGFTKKTHSGITMLDSKWKKIQDNHVKENNMKSTTDAKNHSDKNHSPDVVSYDESRVHLKGNFVDSYVNASHLKQISSWAIPIVISDLPPENNYPAFWHMVFQQKVAIIVCLLTEIELQGKFYGPTAKSQMLDFPSGLMVTLEDINCNVNWTERKLLIKYKKETHLVTHYQINVFPARVVSAPLVMLVDKVLNTKDENRKDDDDDVLPTALVHCGAGAGRTSLIVLLMMVMCQVRAGYVDLRDMLDSGIKYLCSTRTNVLEDTKYLVDIYRTVLFYVQGVLCSGTVMFNGEAVSVPSGASIPPPHITHSKRSENVNKFSKESFEEMKQAAGLKSGDMQDPLSYLDPLWSLKKRKD